MTGVQTCALPISVTICRCILMMGSYRDGGDSTSFLVSQSRYRSPVAGWPIGSIGDYFGLPTVGQVSAGKRVTHSALPFRAYNLIFNEWFRDENLVTSLLVNTGDGPDADFNYAILNRGKRHDYFTSCLPWPQKGDRKSTRLNSSHRSLPRMPSSA